MTMYEVPKMATHPLDKYRNANIDFVTANIVTGSTLLSGANILAAYITGSDGVSGSDIRGSTATIKWIHSTHITGSGTISGAEFQGPLVTSILSSGAAVTGQVTITTGAGLNITQTGNVIVISLV